MPIRIYTPSNLGFGQSGSPFPFLTEQIGSGKGIGAGFKAFGPMSGGFGGGTATLGAAPTPTAPHLAINFDTLGQTIVRSFAHCRLPLRPIWAAPLVDAVDSTVSPTQTFAGVLSMPIDQSETGEFFSIYDGDVQVQNEGGVLTPDGWSAGDLTNLASSLAAIALYPGDEAQLPDPTIVSDKGASKVNANRGLRYVVIPSYPIRSSGGGALPNLSFSFRKTSDEDPEEGADGVEFASGST